MIFDAIIIAWFFAIIVILLALVVIDLCHRYEHKLVTDLTDYNALRKEFKWLDEKGE